MNVSEKVMTMVAGPSYRRSSSDSLKKPDRIKTVTATGDPSKKIIKDNCDNGTLAPVRVLGNNAKTHQFTEIGLKVKTTKISESASALTEEERFSGGFEPESQGEKKQEEKQYNLKEAFEKLKESESRLKSVGNQQSAINHHPEIVKFKRVLLAQVKKHLDNCSQDYKNSILKKERELMGAWAVHKKKYEKEIDELRRLNDRLEEEMKRMGKKYKHNLFVKKIDNDCLIQSELSPSNEKILSLEEKVNDLTTRLSAKEDEIKSLKSRLEKAEEKAGSHSH